MASRSSYGGMTYHIELDDANFQKSLRTMKRDIAETNRSWKQQEAILRDQGKILEANQVRHEGLSKTLKLQKLYNEQVSKAVKDTSRSIEGYSSKMSSATRDMDKGSRNAEKLTYALEKNSIQLDRSSTGIISAAKGHKAYLSVLDSNIKKLKALGDEEGAESLERQKNQKSVVFSTDEYLREGQALDNLKKDKHANSQAIKEQTIRVNEANVAMQKARETQRRYNTGIDELSKSIDRNKSITSSYIAQLKSEYKYASASKAELDGLKRAHSAMTVQYTKEVDELKHIASFSGKASDAYAQQAVKVNKLGTSLTQTSNKINKLNNNVGKMSADSIKTADRLTIFSNKYKSVAESAQYAGTKIMQLTTPLSMVAGAGIKLAGDLQHTFMVTKNLIVNSHTETANEIKTNLGIAQKSISSLSVKYGQSQQKLAIGFQDLIKRGYSSSQAIGAFKTLVQGSVAAGDDFNDVTKVSAQVLEAFGMRAKTTAGMVKNTKTVVNELAYTADLTSTDFQSLGKGMEYVSQSAHQAGFTMSETSAAMGILSNNGFWELTLTIEILNDSTSLTRYKAKQLLIAS